MRRSLALLAALTLTAATAQAQTTTSNATINAQAIVLSDISVAAGNALDFGNLVKSTAKTVAYNGTGAGSWTVTGEPNAQIYVAATLPANLTGPASATLPLSAWTGAWSGTSTAPAASNWSPSAASTTATLSATGSAYFFVGATATPAPTQASGTYTGSVVLTATYVGY